MTTDKKQAVNPYLVLAVCFFAGMLGGFLVGQRGPIAAQVAVRTNLDPTLLSPLDEYIVAGFRCPSPACPSCELKNCECEESQKLRNRVKQELGQGKDGAQIRQDIMAQYGGQIQMMPQ